MGTPMAHRLTQAGHHVSAYDPTPGRAELAGGVEPAGSPAEAAARCDVLVVMVASPPQAESAIFGPEGAASALRPGSRVMLLSTLGPAWVKGLPDRLPQQVHVIDAPVSGGVARARVGTLLVMAAGLDEARDGDEADRALLAELGEVVDVGTEAGAGQSVKLVNQLLCGIHIAAAAEALALAEALGLDVEATWNVVRRGAAASFMLDDRGGRMVNGHDGPVRSATSLFVKDLRLVLDSARATNLPTPVVAAAEQLFTWRPGRPRGIRRRRGGRGLPGVAAPAQ